MERKVLTGYGIFSYGIICALQVKDILRHSPTVGETRSQPQEVLKNYLHCTRLYLGSFSV
ncbi:hypothetical protein H6G97_19350 [Nostoc flagelliforme FACHB-838]|uniref:Transposase n=1 Tax=Nostoc flagelliforme FACHB-838 TaxID=2692904 RepID=A0ABR8DTS7_9NOSO|nr:hypothetical protein [Nostoc flagelliforme FACHB-838]